MGHLDQRLLGTLSFRTAIRGSVSVSGYVRVEIIFWSVQLYSVFFAYRGSEESVQFSSGYSAQLAIVLFRSSLLKYHIHSRRNSLIIPILGGPVMGCIPTVTMSASPRY